MPTLYSADWVLPVESEPIEQGGVLVEDGRILAVDRAETLDGELRHFPEGVIVPGLVNAHTHLEYAVHRGFGDGLEFSHWLRLLASRSLELSFEERLAVARLGVAECLAAGTTTVGDASPRGASALACSELGLRAIVFLEVFGQSAGAARERFEESRERALPSLSERVLLGISPHSPYTAGPEVYAFCRSLRLPLATHLGESAAEQEWLRFGTGAWEGSTFPLTPPLGDSAIRNLAAGGLIDRRTVAAHCVLAEPDEVELLADLDVAVAHCPRSNGLLGCGIAPLRALLDAGVRVGLGTDSPASSGSFDLFAEMRAAIIAARARERRADSLSASEALELATLGSASALGLEREIGSLVPGKRADLAVVSLTGSSYLPWEDPTVALVYGGSPERVELVVIDGEERYRKGGVEWPELHRSAALVRATMLAARTPPA